jgi:putative ABC transport system permease protein
MVIATLDRKLARDLWRLRGQAFAIALIVASGVAVLVMSLSTMRALEASSVAYYERYGFADVFASLKRAPLRLGAELRALDGVRLVELRVVQFAILDMPDLREPVIARLVSLPDRGDPLLNRMAIRAGRLPDPAVPFEVLVGEPFAEAHGLRPGDRFAALLNGRRETLEVAGIGLSPEFVYAIGPGALMPDAQHYGIVWMRRGPLAAAYDLEDSFNDLSLTLAPGRQVDAVLPAVDAMLARYGGIGAYGRANQISHWFLTNEIEQLRTLAKILPAIFLGVAAFLTNMVLARLVFMERSEIGLLKAFGYGNTSVIWHYAKLVLVLGATGLAIGWATGLALGYWMTTVYGRLYRFPDLVFTPGGAVLALSALVALGSSLVGVVGAARYSGSLPPAEAMRPPAPPPFRHQRWSSGKWIVKLDQPTRIIFRQVFRRPVRSLVTSLGVAAAVALLIVSLQWLDALDYIIERFFVDQQRQDLTVGFVEAKPLRVVEEARRLPGVLAVEPMRTVAVRFAAGHRARREALVGLPADAGLTVLRDSAGARIAVPAAGLLLSDMLAEVLDVRAGDRVDVQILQGRQRRLDLPVAAVFETPIGMSAYMELGALNRALGEPDSATALQLVTDPDRRGAVFEQLHRIASIGGATLKSAATDTFDETIGKTMLVMVFFYLAFAATMAFGMVYNNMRIALSERGRELATLRVLGFTPGEVSYMLFGEAALLIVVALPLGCIAGWALAWLMAASFATELFRVPVIIAPATYGWAVVIALATAAPSIALVQRRLGRLDLIGVLKTRE